MASRFDFSSSSEEEEEEAPQLEGMSDGEDDQRDEFFEGAFAGVRDDLDAAVLEVRTRKRSRREERESDDDGLFGWPNDDDENSHPSPPPLSHICFFSSLTTPTMRIRHRSRGATAWTRRCVGDWRRRKENAREKNDDSVASRKKDSDLDLGPLPRSSSSFLVPLPRSSSSPFSLSLSLSLSPPLSLDARRGSTGCASSSAVTTTGSAAGSSSAAATT
jgi:hypothetical protein